MKHRENCNTTHDQHDALQMQHILKARTHMVQSIYTHFDSSSQVILSFFQTTRSKTTTCDQRASALRMHSYARSVCSCVRLYGSKTDNIKWGSPRLSHTHIRTRKQQFHEMLGPRISNVLRLKKVTLLEMTGEGEGSGETTRVDEDPFEKQMRLTI